MSRGNLLQPLANVTSALFATTLFLLAGGLVTAHSAVFKPSVCFTASNWPYGGESHGLAAGVTFGGVDQVRLCLADPALWHRALEFLQYAPSSFAYFGGLVLLMTMLNQATREGIHTFGTAAGVGHLGRYLLCVLPVATLLDSIAHSTLVHLAVTFDAGEFLFFGAWDVPWWAIITGTGLLSLAKIMRSSAEMRADLEGTV